MAASPVPATFTTVGTDVVVVSSTGTFATADLFRGKITKVTKTQVTVDYKVGDRTVTNRYVASRWNMHKDTQMDEYGTRDVYSRGTTLVLATDPTLDARRAAKAKHVAENALRTAASKFAAQRQFAAEDLDAMAAALDAYRATLAPVVTEGTNAAE